MNLIPPSSQCPPDTCFEVVQVCWADGKGAVAGCSTIPAGLLTDGKTVTLVELTPIIMALTVLMVVAWGAKVLLRFQKTL